VIIVLLGFFLSNSFSSNNSKLSFSSSSESSFWKYSNFSSQDSNNLHWFVCIYMFYRNFILTNLNDVYLLPMYRLFQPKASNKRKVSLKHQKKKIKKIFFLNGKIIQTNYKISKLLKKKTKKTKFILLISKP
jgi:hypothetical protein